MVVAEVVPRSPCRALPVVLVVVVVVPVVLVDHLTLPQPMVPTGREVAMDITEWVVVVVAVPTNKPRPEVPVELARVGSY